MKHQWNLCTSEIDEDKLNVIGKGIQEQAKYEVFQIVEDGTNFFH